MLHANIKQHKSFVIRKLNIDDLDLKAIGKENTNTNAKAFCEYVIC